MKKNICIALLLAALGVMAVVMVRQNREIEQLGEHLQLQEQLASAAVEKAHTPAIAAPVAEAKPVEPVSMPAPAPASVTTDVPPAGTGAPTNFFAGVAAMFKDPGMKDMIRAQQKMMLDQMYGGLYKTLGLSSADEETLKKLQLDRQMAMVDAGLAAMNGSGSDTNQAAADPTALKASYDKQIQDFLGPQGYDLFKQYDETVAERTQINLFKQSLSADNALTEQQENDLIAAMYQNRKAQPASSLMNGQTRDPSQLAQLTDDKMAEALKIQEQLQQQNAESAKSILSPQQLDQFAKFQQQMSTMQAASMKMMQAFGNKSAPQPPPATSAPSQ